MGDDIKTAEFPHMPAVAVFISKRSYGVLRTFSINGKAYKFSDGSVCDYDVCHVVSGLVFRGINAKKSSTKSAVFCFAVSSRKELDAALLASTMSTIDLISVVGKLGYDGLDRWVANDESRFNAAIRELEFRENNNLT